MKIKVCGMRDPGNIAELSKLPVDMIGFIFYPGSSRYVGVISPETLYAVPHHISKVGIFVNENIHTVVSKAKKYDLQMIQLHGTESPGECDFIRNKGYLIIKAFSIEGRFNFNTISAYENVCDYFLFDTKTSGFGGSGIQYDWNILSDYQGNVPFFLSGGIGVHDAGRIREFSHEHLFAIDLNSRFEITPGMKDIQSISTFIGKCNPV